MAVLSNNKRKEIHADLMREMSYLNESTSLSKTDLLAAVDALDDFLNNNAAAINSAIPQPARGSLTVTQKAKLLKFVITKRYEENS